MVRLILLGPPGGGKGTQAQTLAKLWQIPHISTGEILRTAVADQTSLGVQAQSYMERGELVPDNLVIALIQERLSQSDAQAGWVLDGFPRNVAQADSLENLLEKMHQAGYYVVNLDVPNEVLITRLLNRGRQDDTEVVVRRRLEVYQEQTAPLINFYRDCQRLININGNAGIEDVMAAIKQSVDTFDHSVPQS